MSSSRKQRRRDQREASSAGSVDRLRSPLFDRQTGFLFLPVVLFLLLSLDYVWITEDAFITFQSVENFWQGFGPNFNRGLRVESFSHPLWFIMLSVLRVFGAEMLPVCAAVVGIILSVSGVFFAIEAARKRWQRSVGLFPLGALIIAVLPPFWQFSSSGLETGLTFFWLGLVSWSFGKMLERPSVWEWRVYAILGLAPIIRPDLVVLVVPLFALALWHSKALRCGARHYLFLILIAALPGVVWQVFRMGYYAALFPNTYIAKEGLESRWDQGLIYLWDLLSTYLLMPTLAAVVFLAFQSVERRWNWREWLCQNGVVAALLLGGAIHALMVCRSGGDFMHARLLLPALFAAACAGAVVPLPSVRTVRMALVTVALGWGCWVCLCARPSYGSQISKDGIADERRWYVKRSFTNRPVTLKDYEYHSFYRVGEAATIMAKKSGIQAIYWAHIGIAVGVIPDHITVIDPLALNDHIGSRIEISKRGRPGHEKIVPAAWFVARYPPPTGLVVINQLDGIFSKRELPARIEAAQLVLSSPRLMELHEAVSAPMSAQLFVKNIGRAWRLTFLRIPSDPLQALERFPAASIG